MTHFRLFLLGMPKCGTTFASELFAQHPAICLSDPKEPRFFATDIVQRPIQDRESYDQCFRGGANNSLLVDGSVDYYYTTNFGRSITEVFEHSKGLFFFRPHAELLHSMHWQEFYSGIETEADIEVAWRKSLEAWSGVQSHKNRGAGEILCYPDRLRMGYYANKLSLSFGADNVAFIDFSRLSQDPQGFVNFVCDFCTLHRHSIHSIDIPNAHRRVGKPWMNRLAAVLRNNSSRVPPIFRLGIARRLKSLSEVGGHKRQPLDPGFAEEITAYFAEDEAELRRVLGSSKAFV